MGFIKTDRFKKMPKYASKYVLEPTGKPIEVLRDFMSGGVDMDIPVFYPLTGEGVYGDKQLLGNEEDQKIAYKRATVCQIRHGIKVVDNKMSKQALQDPRVQAELMKGGSNKLGDWYSRWIAYQPYMGFVEGAGMNQTATLANGGLALTRRSHPNFYTAGNGRITFSLTQDTYEASIKSGITGLTNTASDKFGTEVIKNMVYAANRDHSILPINVGGMNLYPIVIHSDQAYQLSYDTKWNNRMMYSIERILKKNPFFTGKIAGIYEGALLFVDDYMPAIHTGSSVTAGWGRETSTHSTAASGVYYGVENPMSTIVDTSNYKLAILFGKSAITCGYGSQLGFETEEWDYRQKKTEGGDMIVGFERADIYDQDGDFDYNTGSKIYENGSSLIMATYSPSTLQWAS